MDDPRSFRDALLAVEPPPPALRERLQREIRAMTVRELTRPRRVAFALLSAFAFVSAGVCALLAATEPDLPPLPRGGLGAGSLFGVAWGVWLLTLARRGEIDLRRDAGRTARMVWVFTVLMVVFFLLAGLSSSDPVKGLLLIAQSLAFLIGAAVYWLNYRIEAAELVVKEQLLRMELQIAELARRE